MQVQVLQKLKGVLSVAQLKETLEDDKNIYIIMEYCKGGELLASLGRRHYSEATVSPQILNPSVNDLLAMNIPGSHVKICIHFFHKYSPSNLPHKIDGHHARTQLSEHGKLFGSVYVERGHQHPVH